MTAGEIRRAAGCRQVLPAGGGAGGCGNGALPCRAVLQYCRAGGGRLIVCNRFRDKSRKRDNATDEKFFFTQFKLGVIGQARICWPGSGGEPAGVSVGQSVAGRSPGRRQGAAGGVVGRSPGRRLGRRSSVGRSGGAVGCRSAASVVGPAVGCRSAVGCRNGALASVGRRLGVGAAVRGVWASLPGAAWGFGRDSLKIGGCDVDD